MLKSFSFYIQDGHHDSYIEILQMKSPPKPCIRLNQASGRHSDSEMLKLFHSDIQDVVETWWEASV